MTHPDFVEEDHLRFLDELRASGRINMFGARPHLLNEFPELNSRRSQKDSPVLDGDFRQAEKSRRETGMTALCALLLILQVGIMLLWIRVHLKIERFIV